MASARFILIALAVALLAVTACRFDADFGGSRYACATDEECPGAQSCFLGYCQAGPPPIDEPDAAPPPPPPDAAPPPPMPDAAPGEPDAAPPPPPADAGPCLAGQFHDDFTDPAVAPIWDPWGDPPAATIEVGGFFVVTLAAGTTGSYYAGYSSEVLADARQQHIQVEIAQVPTQVPGTNVFFKIERPDNYRVNAMFIIEDGTLFLRTEAPGITETTIDYDPVAHRYLAFDTGEDSVDFMTSPDGVAWSKRFSATTTFPLAEARIALGAGTYKSVANPGNAVFARIGTAAGAGCP